MRQLSLFEMPLPAEAGVVALGAQLDLFDQRSLGLARVGEALRRGELDAASAELASLCARLPDDRVIRAHARAVRRLRERLEAASLLVPRSRATAVLGVARELLGMPVAYRPLGLLLLRRAADEWRRCAGDHALLEGRLPGELLWESGDLASAQASLRRAAQAGEGARARFRLADLTVELGAIESARRFHRDALLLDPHDDAFALVRDSAVRSLPDVAETEVEIEEDPVAWAAPVGVVLGVLPRIAGGEEERSAWELVRAPAALHVLTKARQFVEVLSRLSMPEIRTDREAVIAARRRLKALCPALFRVYLRGLGG